jgi:hypothetical protein
MHMLLRTLKGEIDTLQAQVREVESAFRAKGA